MTSKEYVEIFNKILNNKNLSLEKEVFPLIYDYLTENNIKNSDKLIDLISKNLDLINIALPKIIDYYRLKHNIYTIFNNNKPILYYVTNSN